MTGEKIVAKLRTREVLEVWAGRDPFSADLLIEIDEDKARIE